VGALALGVRAVGLTTSFELWVDEMLYSDLGASLGRGEIPRLADGPFFLHPPGYFAIEAAVIRLLGLDTTDSMSLALDLRWLTAFLGAISVALVFLLVRRVAGTWLAFWAGLVLAFDPFVLRNNSRVLLETASGVAVLAGLLVLVHHLDRRGRGHAVPRLLLAGLLLGYGVFTKDLTAFYAVVPVLLAVAWKHTLYVREGLVVLIGTTVPYLAYLVLLLVTGHLGDWWAAKERGFLRLAGAEQSTGFNSPDSPSLVDRLVEQVHTYGTSYVLLLLCPLAGLFAIWSRRPDRRLIGLTALVMGGLGVFLAGFGTFEEHFGYPVMLACVSALAVCVAELRERRPRLRRPVAVLALLFLGVGVTLGARLELTEDDGFQTFRTWASTELPDDARVGLTNDTSLRAFGDGDRFGPWTTASLLLENQAQYVLTVRLPTEQGYALATPEMLEWLEANATPVFRHAGPTNGETTVWFIEESRLRWGASRGVGGAPPEELSAGTVGADALGGGDDGPP
jgi:hypothetical protein